MAEHLFDLEALRDLDEAVTRWGYAHERSWRFSSAAADEALVEAHTQVEACYGRLSAEFVARHPKLAEHHRSVAGDPHGDAGGYFVETVRKLRKRFG